MQVLRNIYDAKYKNFYMKKLINTLMIFDQEVGRTRADSSRRESELLARRQDLHTEPNRFRILQPPTKQHSLISPDIAFGNLDQIGAGLINKFSVDDNIEEEQIIGNGMIRQYKHMHT